MQPTDYSVLADRYAAHRRPHPGVVAELAIGLTAESRVLELGCGTGNYLAALGERVGCDAIGIDPSPQMLEQLRARGLSSRALEGRAERLDFADAEFDRVYSVDVIHHVADRPAAFREAFRVLKNGALVCTVTDSEWMIRNRRPQSVYFPETIDVELARYPSIDALRDELTAAGFESLRERVTERSYEITDAAAYRDKVYSSLIYISDDAFRRGLERLEADLRRGPVQCVSRYLLLWGKKSPSAKS